MGSQHFLRLLCKVSLDKQAIPVVDCMQIEKPTRRKVKMNIAKLLEQELARYVARNKTTPRAPRNESKHKRRKQPKKNARKARLAANKRERNARKAQRGKR